MTTHSLRDIAVDNCLTESQVLSVLRAVDFPKPDLLPQTLCIDGFKGSSGVYDKDSGRWNINRFHCNISDGSIGCVVNVLPRMNPEYLLACFRDCSPQQRRRALQKAFRSDNDEISCQILKRSARLLTTSATNQKQYRKGSFPLKAGLLGHTLSLFGNLREAYEALMGFHAILEESAYSVQRVMLTDWLTVYTASAHEGTRRCANTIRHYCSYIRNSWKYGKSNAPCEGLNNKIKILKRSCYGVHYNPGSHYICIARHHPASDFLDVYHMDREIRAATKNMTPREREAYLKDCTGWKDNPPDDGTSFLPINEDKSSF